MFYFVLFTCILLLCNKCMNLPKKKLYFIRQFSYCYELCGVLLYPSCLFRILIQIPSQFPLLFSCLFFDVPLLLSAEKVIMRNSKSNNKK